MATLVFSPRSILFAYPSANRGTPIRLNLANRAIAPLPPALPTSVVQLSPDATTLASSAASIERWTINGTLLNPLATATTESCGNLWFIHSGSRLFTACAVSYISSDLSPNHRINRGISAADHPPTRAITAVLTANANNFQSDVLSLIPD